MSSSTSPGSDPNSPFLIHSGVIAHSHQHCKACFKVRRCEGGDFQVCAGCQASVYCSRECQRSHWKMHKGDCKATARNRNKVEEYTKDTRAWAHFMAWLEYHHATLRNATIAALDLRKNPGADNMCFLEVQVERISPEECANKPPMAHFRVVATKVINLEEDTGLALRYKGTWVRRPEFIEMGKRELGRSFKGTLTYIVTAHYSETVMWHDKVLSEYCVPYVKLFSVGTENLGTPNPNWETILRTNIDIGHKMRFCCGKTSEGNCCCGGWTHEVNKK